MTITYRGVSTLTNTSSSPASINAVSGIAEFDQMLLQISTSSASTVTPPSGFTLVEEITGTAGLKIYKKTATSSEPASYSFSFTGTPSVTAGLVAWTPAAGKAIVVDVFNKQTNTSSVNRVWPSVTTTRANDALNCFGALDSGNRASPDALMLERYDFDSFMPIYLMTQIVSAIGATGTRTAVGASPVGSKCITVALYETDPPVGDPSSLSATAISTSQINLAWLDNSSNETGFEIERSATGAGSWSLINTTAAGATSYSNTGLAEHATWYYRVRAVNADGNTGYTSTVNATTFISPPTGLSATANGSTQIDLAWTNPSGISPTFKIERSLTGIGSWSEIATTAANATSYSDTSLSDNTQYFYRVRAASGSDRSTYTSVANATTADALAAPTGLNVTVLSVRRLQLDFSSNNSDETGTEVYRSLNGVTGFTLITTLAAGVTTYVDSGLEPNTEYFYKVRDKKTT